MCGLDPQCILHPKRAPMRLNRLAFSVGHYVAAAPVEAVARAGAWICRLVTPATEGATEHIARSCRGLPLDTQI